MKKPRIPNGMSQTALAERIGYAPRSINEICNDKCAIRPLMAMRSADAFDNTPEFWMEWGKQTKKKVS